MSLIERKCVICRGPIEGRKDRKTCSDRCRTALNRAETDAVAVTSDAVAVTKDPGAVTQTGVAVTGTAWAADEPSDEMGHWQAEEEPIWR